MKHFTGNAILHSSKLNQKQQTFFQFLTDN